MVAGEPGLPLTFEASPQGLWLRTASLPRAPRRGVWWVWQRHRGLSSFGERHMLGGIVGGGSHLLRPHPVKFHMPRA